MYNLLNHEGSGFNARLQFRLEFCSEFQYECVDSEITVKFSCYSGPRHYIES